MFWKKSKNNDEIIKAKLEALKIVSETLSHIENNIFEMDRSEVNPIDVYLYKKSVDFHLLQVQREMLIKEITNA